MSSTTTSVTSTSTILPCGGHPCGYCGDNIWQEGEKCDGTDPGRLNGDPNQRQLTCQDFGFPEGGVLTCSPECDSWGFNGCYWCNNGRVEPGEECDGSDLGGHGCPVGSYEGSVVSCTSIGGVCRIDYSECRRCGDGEFNGPGEECDDGNNVSGDGCSATCKLECGDGITATYEECDDGNHDDGDGCNALCRLDGENPYAGGTTGDTFTTNGVPAPSTTIDACGAVVGVSGVTNGAAVTCRDGTACDKDTTAGQCTFQYFVCFSRSVAGTCGAGFLQQVSLLGPTLSGTKALSTADQPNFLNLARNVLGRDGGTVTTSGVTVSVSPASSRGDQCASARLAVLTSELPRVLAFAAVGAGRCQSGLRAGQFCQTNADCLGAPCSNGSYDQDQLTFQCTP